MVSEDRRRRAAASPTACSALVHQCVFTPFDCLSESFPTDSCTSLCMTIERSRYNKPEALRWFLRTDGHERRHVIFVDDNASNAFNLFQTGLTDAQLRVSSNW